MCICFTFGSNCVISIYLSDTWLYLEYVVILNKTKFISAVVKLHLAEVVNNISTSLKGPYKSKFVVVSTNPHYQIKRFHLLNLPIMLPRKTHP